jgi:DNA-binding PadR family transcriptional regulator
LTPAVFHILLALSIEDRHGYAIMKQVERDSQGTVTMGAGTLYGSLKRMLDASLVEQTEPRVDPDDERRIYYRLTEKGRQAFRAEVARITHLATLAAARSLAPEGTGQR